MALSISSQSFIPSISPRTETKKDDLIRYKMQRVPFLEEQIWKIREEQKHVTVDLNRLLLSEDNRYDFVNEIAEEATALVESNIDEYGGKKKAILHWSRATLTSMEGRRKLYFRRSGNE